MALQDVLVVEGALSQWITNSSMITTFIVLLHQFFVVQPIIVPASMPTISKAYIMLLFAVISIVYCVIALYPYVMRITYIVAQEDRLKLNDDGFKPSFERMHLLILIIITVFFLIGQAWIAWYVMNDAFERDVLRNTTA
jgi:hypothetical protein